MKTHLFIFSLLIILLLSSCSNNDDESFDSLSESKLVKTEKIDENIKIDYSYDVENHLEQIVGTYPSFTYVNKLKYDSNDKVIENNYQESGSSNYSDTYYYNYDLSGRLSSYYSDSGENVSFEYNGNEVIITGNIEGYEDAEAKLELNSLGLVNKFIQQDQYTTLQYDQNKNVIAVKLYNNNNDLLSELSFTHDNNINPYYGQLKSIYLEKFIEFFWEFDGTYYGEFQGYSFPYSKNNILSASAKSEETIYSYVYKERYPVNVVVNYPEREQEYTVDYY